MLVITTISKRDYIHWSLSEVIMPDLMNAVIIINAGKKCI